MAEGKDRHTSSTARFRPVADDDPAIDRDERFSRPKEIPEHILDGIELPSAPADLTPPPKSRTRAKPLLRKAKKPAPKSPRRPGQRAPSKQATRETSSNNLLSGAQLFQKGSELPAIGEFAGYQVLGRLAIGGMAEILLARKPGQAEPIVLKKILATYDSDDEFVEMFLDEARVGMQLEHPNIGRFLDAGEERGRYYIAMEWVNGVTLAKLVRRASKAGGIPPVMASAIVRAIADALHYAHTSRDVNGDLMGLIHRDVSPHNIMIGYDGTVKLLDFGIAKAMGAAHVTAAGVVKGKFAYMAPEQCEGEAIDFRSDIFALGVVLFEALTGKRLFRRGSDRETVRAIVRERVPALSEHWVAAPRELEAICATALDKDPTARFPTSAAMRDVLTLYIEGQRADVGKDRIAELVQSIFAKELRNGPNVDSTLSGDLDPVSYSVSRSIQESNPALAPLSSPTLAKPTGTKSRPDGRAKLNETAAAPDASPPPPTTPQPGRDRQTMPDPLSMEFPSPFDTPDPVAPELDDPPTVMHERARATLPDPLTVMRAYPEADDPRVDPPTVMRPYPAEDDPRVDPPTVMRPYPESEDAQVDPPTVMRPYPEDEDPHLDPPTVMRSIDPPTVMQERPDASDDPPHGSAVMQSRILSPGAQRTLNPPAPKGPLPEPDHAWTEDSTAVQNAKARDAVLKQIQRDRQRESSEWPAWADPVPDEAYDVDVDVASAPATPAPEVQLKTEAKSVSVKKAGAKGKGKSKVMLDVLGVLVALGLTMGLVWFFIIR